MQLKIGGYSFDANTNLIATSIETLFNEGEQPYAQVKRLEVEGYLTGAGQNALTALENTLKGSMLPVFGDLNFYNDDGSLSSIGLQASGSISGVKVMFGPSFPSTMGPEYATERHFRFSAEAEYPLSGTSNFLLSFEETVEITGGGPLYTVLPALRGPAQRQLIYEQTPQLATQRGTSVGYLGYPPFPGPIWPDALRSQPNISRRNPRRRGNGYQGFPVSWSYEYVSAGNLVGFPNLWIS